MLHQDSSYTSQSSQQSGQNDSLVRKDLCNQGAAREPGCREAYLLYLRIGRSTERWNVKLVSGIVRGGVAFSCRFRLGASLQTGITIWN